jgi:hypothetical protein
LDLRETNVEKSLHNKELHNFTLQITNKDMGLKPCIEDDKKNITAYSLEKTGGKRPLGRFKRKWKYNIKTYLQEIWREVVDSINLSHDNIQVARRL